MLFPPLPASFYRMDALKLAQALLGKLIVHRSVVLSITETEAYLPLDSACHAFRGQTQRNAPMFGPSGHSYIYLCYGIHALLNVVTNVKNTPQAVLIRAIEPVSGIGHMEKRRRQKKSYNLTSGPGKLTQALGLSLQYNGTSLQGKHIKIKDIRGLKPATPEDAMKEGANAIKIKNLEA